jgi:hypothetical protein
MTRTARNRTMTTYGGSGSRALFYNGALQDTATSLGPTTYGSCGDSHGRPVIPSPLSLTKVDVNGISPMNGTIGSLGGGWCSQYQNYRPATIDAKSPYFGHCATTSVPSASTGMTDLLVRSNPSRAGKVVPLSLIQDLVDIPKQLRDVGRSLLHPRKKILSPGGISSQYLGWEFGWLPLIEDARNLMTLGQQINQRVLELNRLYSGKGLRRRIHMGRWTFVENSRTPWDSFPSYTHYVNVSRQTIVERWGVVRWKPAHAPRSHPTDAEIWTKARQLALGLTVEATLKGAWDVLPWTWIVNWFSNVGNYALQFSNTVPASPSESCVMTRTTTSTLVATASGFKDIGGTGSASNISKGRYVGSGALSAHLPILDGWRLSILSALAVQRLNR